MGTSPFILQHLILYKDNMLPTIHSSRSIIEFGTYISSFEYISDCIFNMKLLF